MGILTGLSLFSGAGGLDIAAKWAGIRTVCYVEYDPYAQGVLMSRMREELLDAGPIWDDVQTFDGTPWRGKVDCVFGGFPCQDLSIAGNQDGIREGNRSGLWKEFARIIREVGPRYVLVENVPGLLLYGQLGVVLGDLAEMGFDAEWYVLSAGAVGAPHLRERVWVVAYSNSHSGRLQQIGPGSEGQAFARNNGQEEYLADTERLRPLQPERGKQDKRGRPGNSSKKMADAQGVGWGEGDKNTGGSGEGKGTEGEWARPPDSGWWSSEPNVGRVANGVAFRVDRLRCLGNGVVPQQAFPAFQRIVEMSKSFYLP